MLSIYIHIPFCRRKCPYCDFFSRPASCVPDNYITILRTELSLYHSHFTGEVQSVYFGGGTPSLLTASQVEELLRLLSTYYTLTPECEITLECNPEQASLDYFQALRAVGINRLSVGVQSLDDNVLRFLGRGHSAQQAITALKHAERAHFTRLSADVIYGIPFQKEGVLKSSLSVLSDIEHISAYHLSIEEATPFGKMQARGKLSEVDEEVSVTHFSLCDALLREAGYEHYEISSFAHAGGYSRHNMGYWFDRPYLGLGAGAHSYDGAQRWWNPADLVRYAQNLDQRLRFPERELLTDQLRWEEWLMTRLRTRWGISLTEGAQRFSSERMTPLLATAKPLVAAGLLVRQDDNLFIPPQHFLTADQTIRNLL